MEKTGMLLFFSVLDTMGIVSDVDIYYFTAEEGSLLGQCSNLI
jgi:hypothetical protein